MNQAASATRSSPAGATATAGCCPMFNTPFFVNTFAPQTPLIPQPTAQPCFLGTQGTQHAQISSNQRSRQQSNAVISNQQSVSQQQVTSGQPQQSLSQRPQDHTTTNNYNTSTPNLSLQHLFASRHPASSCMALAAALASASFPHFQHQQQPPQSHQSTPINQPTNLTASNPVNPVAPANAANTTLTNQVPLLNFNSYSAAQPFLNLSTPAVPPVAAHLNSSTNIYQQQQHQQQTNSISSAIQATTPSSVAPSNIVPPSANDSHNGQHQRSSVATNNSTNQQPSHLFRNVQPIQQQQNQPTPMQQLNQGSRNFLNEETLNNLFNDQFQAILLNQLFSNQQFAPPLATQATQLSQPQQIAATQVNTSRPQNLAPAGQSPAVMPPAQQIATQIVPQSSEQVSDNQAFQQHSTSQSRVAPVPLAPSINSTNGIYPTHHQTGSSNQQHHASSESMAQQPHSQPQGSQVHAAPQQQSQPQTAIPPMPFYSFPQMEQAIALLTNPQVANNIFSHVFNIYLQSGLRSEPHHTHHAHHQQHHFHHHLHGAHHHHHGPNGQGNGQDATMPLDSLGISESKPRGLTRAEIDSLTPHIHSDEKDPSTCVICLSKFELKSKIRPLSCNHAFHAKCVDKWLRANRTCPICRRDALRTYNAKIKRI